GLLTAAFFVASYIHVRVGPTTVHLLLNGLVGLILGGRAVIAVAVGLVLQAIMLGHGGFTTLGLNCAVIALPALLARPAFRALRRAEQAPSFRYRDGWFAVAYIFHPLFMAGTAAVTLGAGRLVRVESTDADFRAGFAVGFGCVLLTALLNAALLVVA